MGCGSQTKAASQLPIINSTAKIASRGKGSRAATKATAQPLRPICDFHCPNCGLTKPNYPNYFHRCPGVDANGPIDYQAERAAICGACDHARGGICLPLKTKHPDYPCEIAVGLRMPGVRCPLGDWERVLFACDKCGSVRFNSAGLIQCPTCYPKSEPKVCRANPV